ncbi:hypothetical protein A6E05_05610 [Aliivibrio sp. 1S165]|uniref:hypothetical protein n=1 Tax=unclassified Aliivibrio TaxID=2645654 RepID=UPI00080E953A|nr:MULTISPECIES: hypothetical protein [unclassified Aliivibrio]OCH13783.1 hypothetical protein A6E05_05610 [Aliivibrio sp. 1S165]OCH31575.1 hypothetical protein A6E06_02825 [Aliivibrio sp. 1S175]
MLSNIIISGITLFAVLAGLGIAIWSYLDTRRKFSHNEFIEDRKQQRKEAQERFKDKTRLGKR